MANLKIRKTVARNPKRRRKVSRAKTRSSQAVTRRKAHKRAKSRRNRKTRSNPVPVLISMGAVNPRRKRSRKTVARKRRRSRKNTSAASKRRRNPMLRTKKRNTRRRRNPEVFGRSVASGDTLKMILGGLIGVTLTKTAVGMLPANLVGNAMVRVVATGALAFGAGALAKQTGLGPSFADAVTFGGLMQAGSTALTEFVPGGNRIALSGIRRRGMGDLVTARFTTPNNPLKLAAASMASAAAAPPAVAPSVSGFRQVFKPRF